MDRIRIEAEFCDSLQSFFTISSLGNNYNILGGGIGLINSRNWLWIRFLYRRITS